MDKNNLTKEQLWDLRNEIVLCSLFIDDYENSFGIDPVICSNFFDSYTEELGYLMEDDNIDADAFFEHLNDYDTIDNLYTYYYSLECPFGE